MASSDVVVCLMRHAAVLWFFPPSSLLEHDVWASGVALVPIEAPLLCVLGVLAILCPLWLS